MQEKNNLPLVSVYTCVYNGEKTIHRVFESMKQLDYPNFEHVIVNDGSTDSTEELVKQYIKEAKFPVKYHKKENGGKHSGNPLQHGCPLRRLPPRPPASRG